MGTNFSTLAAMNESVCESTQVVILISLLSNVPDYAAIIVSVNMMNETKGKLKPGFNDLHTRTGTRKA